ncbi:hypothetical protein ALQ03_101085 [Pseudomonas savastanoi pv. glycinea]|uniref:Uncharacterized protein n=3 Tax=Pseudomonas savastanoi TaxID=29438 RepID=A0A3M4I046_PSESG|nr:hypothetical protein [Pseudomonas savastanoi]EFW81404.1 hypothetical protein PsgB076_07947 [Pseudomonas savastanoi pv. glycinea str. B076]EFW83686.1 hypothetical protein PsgRace4_22835 [Pseudomonas savastanoi pv. glycinea str. race 4]MCQ3004066.1 hypothetical protein [Pseudomonas savastanoi]RML32213.1 hypothetical protein ALQ97_03724 [Pseudomonas savastanoi pv. glycinea]RMM93254.1 hypothetical protein ALQ68_02039 [Pseudomonas savastanoi pv. glycinea]
MLPRRQKKPASRAGFCKRRLTRHDWNDGNNNLAEVLLDEVHGPEVRSTRACKSIVPGWPRIERRAESATIFFVCLIGSNIFISHWHFNVDLAVSYFSFNYHPYSISQEGEEMDEYQEELLEYRASELDPVEPADDATEL